MKEWNQKMKEWTHKMKNWEIEVLPHEIKGYLLLNTLTINHNNGRSNRWFMGWSNLIVGFHDLRNVAKAYINIVNAIITFVDPTPTTNIITNDTILTKYIIKQLLKGIIKKVEAAVRK